MNAEEFIQFVVNLGIEGDSDADIATKLQDVTITDISTKEARQYLRESKLWRSTSTGFKGRIQTYIEETGTPPSHVDEIDEFHSELYGGGQLDVLKTNTDFNTASAVKDVLSTLRTNQLESDGLDVITNPQRADFYALGGGRPWKNITTQNVTDGRAAYAQKLADDAAAEQEELDKQALNVLVASHWNAVNNGTGVLSFSAMTSDQAAVKVALQALVDLL